MPLTRTVIGTMTGTSLDGIDVAISRVTGRGESITADLIGFKSAGLERLSRDLRSLAEQKPMTAQDIATIGLEFARAHVRAIRSALRSMSGDVQPDLIALHGQTVFHQPPVSWQLVNPWPVANEFNCPIVTDLRGADLAGGGQGAPITPLADWILFRHPRERRAVVNLGGFINITILPTDDGRNSVRDIQGFDLCACNHILDGVARRALGKPFDEGGAAALRGKADARAVNELERALLAQRDQQRSLGTGDEAAAWVDQFVTRLSPDNLAASAVEAIARVIRQSVAEHDMQTVILAGGSAMNRALTTALAREDKATPPFQCHPSDEFDVPLESREALAMAVLGALAWDGVPITLPHVTGGNGITHRAGLWCLPATAAVAGRS